VRDEATIGRLRSVSRPRRGRHAEDERGAGALSAGRHDLNDNGSAHGFAAIWRAVRARLPGLPKEGTMTTGISSRGSRRAACRSSACVACGRSASGSSLAERIAGLPRDVQDTQIGYYLQDPGVDEADRTRGGWA
jgi:hypothetical protein